MKTLENANNSGGEEKCLCQCSIALVLDREELPQYFAMRENRTRRCSSLAAFHSSRAVGRSILISQQALWRRRFREALIESHLK
jgi:hypothetical protein